MWTKSWKIAQFAGIPVKIHWSFGLMILYVLLIGWKESMDWPGILGFELFVLLLFLCVLLHEYGHALTARKYGVDTRDIIISPIGGMARLLNMPERPTHELWVAIMGPAVNLVIAALLALVILSTPLSLIPQVNAASAFTDLANLPSLLMWVNIGLVIFNLIPAFPMDGGRIFRAILAMRWSRLQATKIATYTGQGLAVIFIGLGLYNGEYLLPFIGVFVFMTASFEYRNTRKVSRARNAATAGHLAQPCTPVFIYDKMERVFELFSIGSHNTLLIMDHNLQPIGRLKRNTLEQLKQEIHASDPVLQHMNRELLRSRADQKAFELADQMTKTNAEITAVYSGDHFLGVITAEDLTRWGFLNSPNA